MGEQQQQYIESSRTSGTSVEDDGGGEEYSTEKISSSSSSFLSSLSSIYSRKKGEREEEEVITITEDYYHHHSSSSSPPLLNESTSWDLSTIAPTTTGTSANATPPTPATGSGWDCSSLDYDYEPTLALISTALFILGIFFCIFGYRCFKFVLFLTGASFALLITFGLCQVEDLLPQYGNVGISILAGVLYGLICYLVPYVGFFTLGFLAGLLTGLGSMLFIGASSVWISVLFLLGAGLFGAVGNVCWPAFTVCTTSLIGGAGISICFDYFVEKGRMVGWIWGHVSGGGADNHHHYYYSTAAAAAVDEGSFCWFSWLLLGLWPVLLVVGIIVQCTLTANTESIRIYGYHERDRSIPRRRLTREERALARQAKYRYLYQVRTAGGDYISQTYLQFLQSKNSHVDTLSTHMSTLPNSTQEDAATNVA